MDNGSNVCGIEFNYDNEEKEEEEEEARTRGGRSRGEGGGQGEGGEEAKDDPESLIGAVNNQIMGKLFPGFGVKSEVGRWVHPEFEEEVDTSIEVEAGTEEEEDFLKV